MKRTTMGFCVTLLAATMTMSIGCGGVEDSNYKGESLFELSGTVKNESSLDVGTSDIHVGLMWIFDHGNGDEVGMLDSVIGSQFPVQFDLNLYNNPADSLLMTFEDASGDTSEEEMPALEALWPKDMKIGLAYIVVWQDTNGNGKFDYSTESDSDKIIGGAPDFVVVFVQGAVPPDAFYSEIMDGLVDGQLQLGYTLLKTNGKHNCYERDGEQVCGSWDQVVPVEPRTQVELILTDDVSEMFPNVN